MTKRPLKDVGTSVRARLLRIAHERGEDFQLLLTRYANERLLFRLASSAHSSRFVLKGAALFTVWTGKPHRATRDLDLLGFGEPGVGPVRESGAQVNVQSSIGGMPIHMAALTGQKTLVQMLLDKGAEVDAKSKDGVTPLYQAARKDASEVAALLIARHADVNARTMSGNTALMIAADGGNAQVAKLLLEHRAEVDARDNEGFPPLLWACRSLLVRYTLDASTPGTRDMRARALHGRSAASSAAELAKTREALGELKGNFGAVALLLVDAGADPNVTAPGFTPLGAAAVVGDKALVAALIAHGARIDDFSKGESPLHAAIAEGHGDVAELIVDKGANVNARNVSQLTPLHFLAVFMHDRKMAELLIRHGADVNARDQGGHTPLEGALRERNNEVAEVLRQHGAK